ncbi:alcohol dehydrogenase catalytic domain-containing protein [Kocuria kalidii]|uniref:alcohol dehydrogenase catalytic domain-containing protein n=1 Tax=Kocuria kalidii TaxID=3376283 RepID=UPI0037A7FF43
MRVHSTGAHTVSICDRDVHYFTHGRTGPYVVEPPMVRSHETAGMVRDVGKGVTHLAVGDWICMEPGIPPRARGPRAWACITWTRTRAVLGHGPGGRLPAARDRPSTSAAPCPVVVQVARGPRTRERFPHPPCTDSLDTGGFAQEPPVLVTRCRRRPGHPNLGGQHD